MPHVSELSAQVRAALDAAVAAIGGQPREGQIEMAEAVANALTDRHHLMVQAGTGTGKSLAYLVPALVHGRKVLVATATLALQRQLVERDLPAVVPALEKVFDRHGNPNETIVLDKLELDCGNLSYSNWEEEFLQKILVQLEEKLKLPQIGKKEIVPVEKKAEEVFTHFLEKGYFPWNSPFSSPRELENSVVLEMSFLENLKKILIKSPAFFKRLFGSFSEDFISRIIIAWTQKLNSHESDLVKYLNRSRNTALNKILIRTLALTFSDPDPASSGQFLKILINQCLQENLSALAEYFGQ